MSYALQGSPSGCRWREIPGARRIGSHRPVSHRLHTYSCPCQKLSTTLSVVMTLHARGTMVWLLTVSIHHYPYYADVIQVEGAYTLQKTSWKGFSWPTWFFSENEKNVIQCPGPIHPNPRSFSTSVVQVLRDILHSWRREKGGFRLYLASQSMKI